TAPAAPARAPHLAARGLAVGWPGREPVLHGLDLEVAAGRSVAVVGPSGVGKTTLLLTLAGFLPPRAGEVLLDGVPIDRVDPAVRVARLALTTEDAHVFETTVLENLHVARGDATPAEAEAALVRAGLGDWLAGLPDGVGTALGPDARSISGGERRRLLLARSLLSPAPLLLVDEPAEHLDPATADRLVGDLLIAPRAGDDADRGVLLVTHRLSPLAGADEVLVLRDGTVDARGTHLDLLTRDDRYREAHAVEQDGVDAGSDLVDRTGTTRTWPTI
ncbi:ATP-binding cassette domain-containing protein, partial [Cellulomonas triticagri]